MAEQDGLENRLKQLQEVLDERVTLLTKPPKRSRGKARHESTNQVPQRSQQSSQAAYGPSIAYQGTSPGTPGRPMPDRTPADGTSARETQAAVEFFKNGDFHVGRPLKEDVAFCPWHAVTSYPGRFIGKANRPRARVYFDSIYEGREWHFFYLHNPEKPQNEPFLMVPTAQFVDFLDQINKRLNIALVIPREMAPKFSIVFRGSGTPRPRFLARSSDQRTFKVEKFPEIDEDDIEAYEAVEAPRQKEIQKSLQVFSSRDPDKIKKDERREKEDAGMLLDTQRMLGLRTAVVPRDVVFICIDVEALEREPYPISEIGIAVLDTRDLKDKDPGPAGRDWWPLIKAFHLRVKEYSGLRNFRFVQGCPTKFSFGESTFPPKGQVAEAIMKALKPWYPADRDLVLVGHDVHQDIKYLAELGIRTQDMHFIRQIDSQILHKSWRQLRDGRGLEAVLSELCMQYQWLHNAGNDAVYTMRAVVGVAVEQRREEELLISGEKYVPALFLAK
ncbi:hypothetical protein NLU13_2681 [Sarocladium strictum]|uniref:Gfd2/YDR514C-like C-terminal domain-containing protein n=1 Tax=Sarocladium strictum TaxID=5046 RepID=A0AA39GKY1_SARSR|nr:hypothetical protein NLU13_2681 [Sarocladium strictum]